VTGGSFCRSESLVILTFPGVEDRAGKLSAAEIRLSSQYISHSCHHFLLKRMQYLSKCDDNLKHLQLTCLDFEPTFCKPIKSVVRICDRCFIIRAARLEFMVAGNSTATTTANHRFES
jgi:hypothetical protein